MCSQQVQIPAFEEFHQISFKDYFGEELELLNGFVQDGLLQKSDDLIQVTGNGYLTLRNMAMCFDQHLETIKKNATNPVFSKTV